MSITSVASKIFNDEWMDIKYIGEGEPEFIRPPMVGENWTYTPSGRICAHYRTFCGEQNECCYVITFVDLVDKVCFEMKLVYGQEFEMDEDNLQLDSFYFTSEDELVIVAGYMGIVNQLIYKVDYLAQKLVLKETITHSFLARLDDVISGFMAPQHHKFVRYDGIDYILMVSFNEDLMLDNGRCCIYTIYMIPKDVSNRKAPVKEYQIHLTKEDRTHIKKKIKANLTSISNMFDIIFTIDESSSLIYSLGSSNKFKTMSSTRESSSNEWLDIKFIGRKQKFSCPQSFLNDFIYSPSGRLCAHYRTVSKYCVVTFVDLVEKTCFDIQMCNIDDSDIISLYFTYEDELVAISESDSVVKQMMYKVDYSSRKMELQDTRLHKFTSRAGHITAGSFPVQRHKVVRFNRIDYIVIVGCGEEVWFGDDLTWVFTVYMLPMHSDYKTLSTKEFLLYLTKDDRLQIERKIKETVKNIEGRVDITVNESFFSIIGNKLLFTYKLAVHDDEVDPWFAIDYGSLLGVYWEVDLAKLNDISSMKFDSMEDIQEFIIKQDGGKKFSQIGDLRIAEILHFQSYVNDVGMVNVITNNVTGILLYPMIMNETSKPIVHLANIPHKHCIQLFGIHPQGALLHFDFTKGYLSRLQVLRCLKQNLMSLAFNRALFHNNISIKDHQVYRLCFRQYYKYYNVSSKRALKRKISED